MPEPLTAELALQIQAALRQVDELGRALAAALDSAVQDPLRITAQAEEVTSEIESAKEAADSTVIADAEASDVTTGIDAAVDAADTTVLPDADAGQLTFDIDAAVDAADDTVVVQGDAGDVTSAIDSAIDAADTNIRLEVDSDGITRARTELGRFAGTGEQAAQSVRGIAPAGVAAASGIGGIAQQLGVAKIAGVALAATVLTTGVSYNALEQRSRAAFTTILGSADAANQMMDELRAFASESPFPRQAFIQATQQMLAFGFATSDVLPTLGAVQDAVAAMGGGASEIATIVDVLSKIQSQGRVTATEMNRLALLGIDGFKLLGEAAGISAVEMRKEISTGAVDAAFAVKALTDGMTEDFGGAAENVKNTWTGAVDRIMGSMRDLGSAIVEPFIAKEGGGAALDLVNLLATIIRGTLIPTMTTLGNIIAITFKPVSVIFRGIESSISLIPGPLNETIGLLLILATAARLAGVSFARAFLVATFAPLLTALRAMPVAWAINTKAAGLFTGTLVTMRAAVGALLTAALPLLAVFAAVTVAQELFGTKTDNAAESQRAGGEAARDMGAAYQELADGTINAAQAQDRLVTSTKALADVVLEDLAGSADTAERALGSVGISSERLGQILTGTTTPWEGFTDEELRAITLLQFGNDAIERAVKENSEATVSYLDQQVAIGALTAEQRDHILTTTENAEASELLGTTIYDTNAALAQAASVTAAQTRAAEIADLQNTTSARVFERLGEAVESAANNFPTLGSALDEAIGTVGSAVAEAHNAFAAFVGLPEQLQGFDAEQALAFQVMFGKPGELGAAINSELTAITERTQTFFGDVFALGDSPALQAALLELGPDNVGARMFAALASNEPQVRAGAEQAFRGMQIAQIVVEAQMAALRATFTIQAQIIGSEGGAALARAWEESFGTPITSATSEELIANRALIESHVPETRGAFDTLGLESRTALVAQLSQLPPEAQKQIEAFLEAARGNKQPLVDEGAKLGADFSGGFGFGIFTGRWQAEAAARDMALAARDAASTALRRSSPSLVMMEIGRDVVAGFALGLRQTGLVEVAAGALADSATAAIKRVEIPRIQVPRVPVPFAPGAAALAGTSSASSATPPGGSGDRRDVAITVNATMSGETDPMQLARRIAWEVPV